MNPTCEVRISALFKQIMILMRPPFTYDTYETSIRPSEKDTIKFQAEHDEQKKHVWSAYKNKQFWAYTRHHLQIETPTTNKLRQRRMSEHKRTIFSCLKHSQNISERDRQHLPQIDPSNLLLLISAQIDPSNFRNQRTPFSTNNDRITTTKSIKVYHHFRPEKSHFLPEKQIASTDWQHLPQIDPSNHKFVLLI